jgi:hypothetical protein
MDAVFPDIGVSEQAGAAGIAGGDCFGEEDSIGEPMTSTDEEGVLVLRCGRRHRLGHRQASRPWVICHMNFHWVSLRLPVVNFRMRIVLMMNAR